MVLQFIQPKLKFEQMIFSLLVELSSGIEQVIRESFHEEENLRLISIFLTPTIVLTVITNLGDELKNKDMQISINEKNKFKLKPTQEIGVKIGQGKNVDSGTKKFMSLLVSLIIPVCSVLQSCFSVFSGTTGQSFFFQIRDLVI